MTEHPFWQYLAIEEPEALILPFTNRVHAVIIMSIAAIIITIQTIYMIGKIRQQAAQAGSKTRTYYIVMYLGLFMMALNSVFIRLSIYLTDGQYTVFSQEKAILFFAGTAVFVYGLTFVSFSIIDFRKRTKFILVLIFRLFTIVAGTVVVMQAFIIANIGNLELYIRPAQIMSVLLATTLMLIFMFALFAEGRSNPSKIEKLRLNILSFSVLLVEIIFLTTGSTSIFKDPNDPTIFILLTTYIVPFTYLTVQTIMNILLYWSVLTPNWLLIKSGVIQPSFRDFLKRRKEKGD